MDDAELKRVAEAATPGPWATLISGPLGDSHMVCEAIPGRVKPVCVMEYGTAKAEANAAYIALADPPTIIALLAERERLRGALEAIRASIAHSVVKSPGPDTVKTAGGIVSGDIGAEVFAAFAAIENLARQALEATDDQT